LPAFRFADTAERVYPFLQNSDGEFVGLVKPGAVQNFAEAPDYRWIPAEPAPEAPVSAPEPPRPGEVPEQHPGHVRPPWAQPVSTN
jgi:hypothetical protein